MTENGSGYTMERLPRYQPAAEMRKLFILRLRGKNMKDMENRSLDAIKTIQAEINKKWNAKLAEEFISLVKTDFE